MGAPAGRVPVLGRFHQRRTIHHRAFVMGLGARHRAVLWSCLLCLREGGWLYRCVTPDQCVFSPSTPARFFFCVSSFIEKTTVPYNGACSTQRQSFFFSSSSSSSSSQVIITGDQGKPGMRQAGAPRYPNFMQKHALLIMPKLSRPTKIRPALALFAFGARTTPAPHFPGGALRARARLAPPLVVEDVPRALRRPAPHRHVAHERCKAAAGLAAARATHAVEPAVAPEHVDRRAGRRV